MALPKGPARRDAISAVVLLVVSAAGIVWTLDFPARAATWPLWMWGLLAAFSLILLVESLRRGGAAGAAGDGGTAE